MHALAGKKMIVVGGSRGVGRRLVEEAHRHGAEVLALARQPGVLQELARSLPGLETMSLDATDPEAPPKLFDAMVPDILVICAGTHPSLAPLHEQSWQQFAVNWESDVKIAFHFCKAALTRPLPEGTRIVLVSSGAALAGSPLTGGYAGSKRTQLFIANYSQKESDRLGLGLRFLAIAPRILAGTELGESAIAGYSDYLGISADDFIRSMASPPTAAHAAEAIIELAASDKPEGSVFVVSGNCLETVQL
ncbi:SDR family oxidoreductase [Bradyrhizobium guangzhouense]|uniref:SDR family oxidoreductase n=2 Tax=Bradyrhizobium guangzhouense TaxID=1325095 RepID=A0AAE6C9Q4_9BRAD|nr:short-chain dehydrogenase [Bradyrhizobium guangzhouense]RXH14942.1 SDR family oxidoreductase [Bradyrhizobium guangzhouense]